jgi:hypothetical protein
LSLAGFEPPDHAAVSLVAIPTKLSRSFVIVFFCKNTGDKEMKNKKERIGTLIKKEENKIIPAVCLMTCFLEFPGANLAREIKSRDTSFMVLVKSFTKTAEQSRKLWFDNFLSRPYQFIIH